MMFWLKAVGSLDFAAFWKPASRAAPLLVRRAALAALDSSAANLLPVLRAMDDRVRLSKADMSI
ncbi:hypothetical protein D3C72_2349090 [compost metagenome]